MVWVIQRHLQDQTLCGLKHQQRRRRWRCYDGGCSSQRTPAGPRRLRYARQLQLKQVGNDRYQQACYVGAMAKCGSSIRRAKATNDSVPADGTFGARRDGREPGVILAAGPLLVSCRGHHPVGADTVADLANGGGSTLAKVAASPITKMAANAATGYGATTLGGLLGLSPEASGMIGGMLGFGPHGAGEALQNFANWLNTRAATAGAAAPAAVPPAATYAVPGLLSNTLAGTGGAAGYPYSTP
jgi:hypothetical protein